MPPPYRTIYIVCPANVRTGGPEASHQLGRALIDLGHDARMVYIRAEADVPSSGERRIHTGDPRRRCPRTTPVTACR